MGRCCPTRAHPRSSTEPGQLSFPARPERARRPDSLIAERDIPRSQTSNFSDPPHRVRDQPNRASGIGRSAHSSSGSVSPSTSTSSPATSTWPPASSETSWADWPGTGPRRAGPASRSAARHLRPKEQGRQLQHRGRQAQHGRRRRQHEPSWTTVPPPCWSYMSVNAGPLPTNTQTVCIHAQDSCRALAASNLSR